MRSKVSEPPLGEIAVDADSARQLGDVRRQPHEHPLQKPLPVAASGSKQVTAKPLVCAWKLDQCSSGEMSWPPRHEQANTEFIGSPSSKSYF
jgi:hypothetical protein